MTATIRRLVALGLVGLLCPVAQSRGASSGIQGSQLAAACASCHRLDGRDTGIPPIVGLDENRIVRTMLAYRSGERATQIMRVVAANLSPEEIAAVAHYLSGQGAAGERR